MTETSGFMDPGTYDAAQFARAQFGHIKDGYQVGYLNGLEVIANTPAAMNVLVKTGGAWVQGCWYTSDAVNTLTIDAAHASLDRIDRIILRKTATTNIEAVVLKGTAAGSPAAPDLTQVTDGVWEICLATVLVTHAVTSIAGTGTTLITDTRQMAYAAMGPCTINTSGQLSANSTRIALVADPSGDQDADTKAARNAAISTALAGITYTNVYGDGSDGAIHITGDTGSYSGVKQATTFVVDATKTLTLTGNTIIMATTSITINGTISGVGASPLLGGVGATTSGAGGAASGGYVLFAQNAGAGGMYGGGTGAAQSSINSGYPTYSAVLTAAQKVGYHNAAQIMSMIVSGAKFGSSCGGGGNANAGAPTKGGDGGKGGAILVLCAPTITIAASTGYITLTGGAGEAASSNTSVGAGGGGGGGGGYLILVGKTITVSGTVSYAGGAGGAGAYNNGAYAPANGESGSAGATITFTI